MAWLVTENKLDPQQREFVDSTDINSKNWWIQGFAGSGKSVLLAYTAKKVKAMNPNAKVLVIVFTRSLVEMFTAAFNEIGLSVYVDTYYKFMKNDMKFDYILCDEVQDLPPRVLTEMKRRAKHVVVAGDANQSIYEEDPQWHEHTVQPGAINGLLDSSSFKLRIIHRLSRSIINAVKKLMPGMNMFSEKDDMVPHNTQIRLCGASATTDEVKYIMGTALTAVNVGDTAAVLLPTANMVQDFANKALAAVGKAPWSVVKNRWGKPDYGSLNRYLRSAGLKMQYVGNGYGEFSSNDPIINIMTYHSAKGLDFDNVFIPYARAGMFISYNESIARTLFMVAMTRARKNLYITYTSGYCDYVSTFASDCSKIDISSSSNNSSNYSNSVFGF